MDKYLQKMFPTLPSPPPSPPPKRQKLAARNSTSQVPLVPTYPPQLLQDEQPTLNFLNGQEGCYNYVVERFHHLYFIWKEKGRIKETTQNVVSKDIRFK